jgi:hypothetical protein
MHNPTEDAKAVVGKAALAISEFIKSNNITFGRGDPLKFFTQLGHLHYQFTLGVGRAHADTLVHLKNLYGLWNAVVDDEIDQHGSRDQLDASLQLMLNRTRGEPTSAKDCDAVRTLEALFAELDRTLRNNRQHMLKAFHFDMWDLMNGFAYEYCITKVSRLANSEEYTKYSTMTASIKHYLDLDCLYAEEYPSASDYRHLRVGYEHLGRAIKFASDIGSLKRELKNEDNFNLVRILAVESGISEAEQRLDNAEQYETLMNQDAMKRVLQEVRERAEKEMNTAREHLARTQSEPLRQDTQTVLKAVTGFMQVYFQQDQFAPEAPTAPKALRSVE